MNDTWPPPTPELGHLRINDVFVEYDGPRLFSCANLLDQLFMFLSVEETAELDRWLVVPISPRRLAYAQSKQIDLYDLFAKPEEDIAYRFDFFDQGQRHEIRRWPASELTDDYLPARGTHLLVGQNSGSSVARLDPSVISKQAWRHVSEIRISLPNSLQHQIAVRDLAGLLSPMQEIYTSLDPAYRPDKKMTRGRVPPAMLLRSELQVAELRPGSVDIFLAGGQPAGPLGETPLDEIASRFRDLLECKSDPDRLRAEIERANAKTARSYGALLRAMMRAGASIELTAASPGVPSLPPVKLTAAEAAAAIVVVDQLTEPVVTTVDFVGSYLALDVLRERFTAKESETGLTYKGFVDPRALDAFSRASLGTEYRFDLVGTSTVETATGIEHTEWILTSMAFAKGGGR